MNKILEKQKLITKISNIKKELRELETSYNLQRINLKKELENNENKLKNLNNLKLFEANK